MIDSAFFGDLYSYSPLKRLLLEDLGVNPYLGEADLDALLDPARYTGLAARFVDRVGPP